MGLVAEVAADPFVEPNRGRRAPVGATMDERQAPPEVSPQHR